MTSVRAAEAPDLAQAVAHLLRESRRRQGLTQAEVSLRTGGYVTKPALANYEGGHRSVRIDVFWALTRALGEDPTDLLAAADRAIGYGMRAAPLTVDIAAIEASADDRLEPVRRWFAMRGAAGRGRGHHAKTITLEPGAIEALAALMGVDVAACRDILRCVGSKEVAPGEKVS